MASFNRVILMGNLTRDPELRSTPGGMQICNFGLAVNRRFKDATSGEWKEQPTFVDVTIFGARAEPFARYHKKGKQAFIEGSLRMDTWEDKNGGGKRSKLFVVADTWEFTGSGREGGEGGGPAGGGGFERGGYDTGSAGGGMGSPGGGASGAPGGGGGDFAQQVDDTPF